MIIKLHPSLLKEKDIQLFLTSKKIVQIANNELISCIRDAEYIIAEPSSLTIIPMILNKVIKIINFANFQNLKTTLLFTSYPNLIISNNYLELTDLLKYNIINNLEWKKTQIGETNSLLFDENVTKQILNEF